MVSKPSFNTNGQAVPNWSQLLQWGQDARPAWTTIMDNIQRARQWKDTVGGEMVYRVWDERDNYYHQSASPQEASEQLSRDLGDNKDFWMYYRLNEPGGDWLPLQDWIIAFATENKKRGFKTTSQGLAIMKNWPNPEWVKAGNADKLIRYAYENQDTFIIDVHEYVTGFAWSSHTPNYPANLFDRDLSLQGEKTARIEWDDYADNWYLGRVGWVTNVRAREVVGDVLPFIITESLFDWHSSVHQMFVTLPDGRTVRVEEELKARYGDDRYNRDIRGVLGQRRLFEWLQTGVTNQPLSDEEFADVIIRNLEWALENYPANCKSIQLFTMNENWRFPEGHDYIPIANALLPKMTELAMRTTPTPEPEPEPTPDPIPEPDPIPDEITMRSYTIKAIGSEVRIRVRPTVIDAPEVGRVKTTPQLALVSDEVWGADGYVWRRVEIGAIVGYAAFSTLADEIMIELIEAPSPADSLAIQMKLDSIKGIIRDIEAILNAA